MWRCSLGSAPAAVVLAPAAGAVARPDPCLPWYHSTMVHTMTLRLDDDQASALKILAELDGVSMNEAIRRAVANHIAANVAAMSAAATEKAREQKKLLDRLAKG